MKTVLFEVQHLYYLPQFLPIITELSSRTNYNIYISLSHYSSTEEKTKFLTSLTSPEITIISGNSESDRIVQCHNLSPDIIFIGNKGNIKKIASDNSLVVMVYHGIGLKQSYYNDISDRVDIIAVESQERFNQLISKNYNKNKLVLSGFPKLDPLFKENSQQTSKFSQDLGLNPKKKTILYTPSFYPSSIEKVLKKLIEVDFHFNLLIKLHQFSWTKKKYSKHIQLAASLDKKENVCLLPLEEFNIIPYFKVADLMISDISSTLFEYIILNRPIIQVLSLSLRKKHRIFPFLIRKRLDYNRMTSVNFTTQISDVKNLLDVIKHNLDNPEIGYSERRDALNYFHFSPDGLASKRLIDAIEKNLE